MPESESPRHARLTLARGENGHTLTTRLPSSISQKEFGRVAETTWDIIYRLTGCPCGSGLVRLVTDEPFPEVINVDFGAFDGVAR